jgi:hypothetical protein
LLAWSNYETDLRDYTVEIFDSRYKSEMDFNNPDREPVYVKLQEETKPIVVEPIEQSLWKD